MNSKKILNDFEKYDEPAAKVIGGSNVKFKMITFILINNSFEIFLFAGSKNMPTKYYIRTTS